MVLFRTIFEAFGADVKWDDKNKVAIGIKDGVTIELTIGSSKAIKNKEVINLDVPAQIIDERTMVPLRFVSESLGATVGWDENSKVVIIIHFSPA